MSEEIKSGVQCAIDNLETERKIVYASQEVDIQFAHLKPWLDYRKATADKWLALPPNHSVGRNAIEELFNHINKEIANIMGL